MRIHRVVGVPKSLWILFCFFFYFLLFRPHFFGVNFPTDRRSKLKPACAAIDGNRCSCRKARCFAHGATATTITPASKATGSSMMASPSHPISSRNRTRAPPATPGPTCTSAALKTSSSSPHADCDKNWRKRQRGRRKPHRSSHQRPRRARPRADHRPASAGSARSGASRRARAAPRRQPGTKLDTSGAPQIPLQAGGRRFRLTTALI